MNTIIKYLKRYPISIGLLLLISYLSLFKPSGETPDIMKFKNADKLVHFAMYFTLSTILWWEYAYSHTKENSHFWRPWIYACLCPIVFSGIMEILQSTFTDYRSGEWLDLAANSLGVISGSLVGRHIIPRFFKAYR